MQTKQVVFGILTVAALGTPVRQAGANSCAGEAALANSTQRAAVVFIATITSVKRPAVLTTTNPDGSISGGVVSGPSRIDLSVEEALKGSLSGRLQFESDFPFEANERYLIYGTRDAKGQVGADVCSRVRRLSEAAEDLKYLKGVRSGSAQAVLYGQVMRRRADGERYAPTDVFTLVAMSGGVRHEVATQKYGQFEIVLPPGAYLFWVEQGGRQLIDPEPLQIQVNDERRKEFEVLDSLGRGPQ